MKRNSVTTSLDESKTIKYDASFMRQIMEARDIKQQAILNIFNMTNPTTADNWLSGYTVPPINRVMHLCTMLNIDPLDVISYYGYKFKSRLSDLYLLEHGGKTIREILNDLKIETLPDPTTNKPITEEEAERLSEERQRRASLASAIISGNGGSLQIQTGKTERQTSLEMIDRIIAIQREAANHEAEALKEQREEMQRKIDERDETIQSLQRQVANAQAEAQMMRKYVENGIGSYHKGSIIQDPGHISSHKDVTDI